MAVSYRPVVYCAATRIGWALSGDGRRLSVRLSVTCLTLSREWKGLGKT